MAVEGETTTTTTTTATYSKQFVTWAIILTMIFSGTVAAFATHKYDTVWADELKQALADLKAKYAGLSEKAAATERELAKEKINVKTHTAIEYIPKEIIVYVDPRTGATVTSEELEQMKITQNATKFNFIVQGPSGKQYPGAFTKTESERWVFEKNKGSFTTDTEIKLTVELPKPKPQIRVGAFGGASSDPYGGAIQASAGIRAAYQSKPFDVDLNFDFARNRANASATFWFW